MTYKDKFKKNKFNWLSILFLLFGSIIAQLHITSNAVASEISELSDSLLCGLGVIDVDGKKKWASESYSEKYRVEASLRGIDCLSNDKKSTKHNITATAQTPSKEVGGIKSYDLGKAFKVQSSTKRKQVQYALKKLGFYSKNVDGLWGSGTKNAIESYAIRNNLLYERPETIFRDITTSVNVPKSFAAARSSKSNKKPKSSGESNLLKLLIIGGLCATTPDPSTCLAHAAGSLSGSKRPDYTSIDDGIGSYSGFSSSNSSSRIGSGGRTIWHSDGSSSRISSSGRNIYHSDGSSSRLGAGGRNLYHSDGSSSRLGAGGRVIYNSDGSSCRIGASGRNMYCN